MKLLYGLITLGIVLLIAVAFALTNALLSMRVQPIEQADSSAPAERTRPRREITAVTETYIEIDERDGAPVPARVIDADADLDPSALAAVARRLEVGDPSGERPLDADPTLPFPEYGRQIIVERSPVDVARHQLMQLPERGIFFIRRGSGPPVVTTQ